MLARGPALTERVRTSWPEIESVFREHVVDSIATWVPEGNRHHDQTLTFALGRLDEGKQLAAFFTARGLTGRVLDVGAGNGGVAVGLANHDGFSVVGVDILVNPDLRALRAATPLPIGQVVGSGHDLPFDDASFDIVLCLDTIEHVPRAGRLGAEIMRVLRPGGACMLTTPARIRHWFAPDPHYAIRGLALLPDPLQRFVATTLLKRTDSYDVVHLFWHVREIARLFPGSRTEVLWNHTFSRTTARDRAWYRLRNFFWDRIVLTKY